MSSPATSLRPDQCIETLLGTTHAPSEFDTFLTLWGYRPARGGMSHYVIRAVPYRNVLQESLERVEAMTPEQVAAECQATGGDVGLAATVLGYVRASLVRSIGQGGVAPRYTLVAPGILRHRRTGTLYVTGLVLRRQQVVHAFAKRRQPSTESRIRRWIESRLPVGSWRQFKLERDNWTELRLGEAVLTAREDLSEGDPEFDPYAFGFGKVSAEEGQRYTG